MTVLAWLYTPSSVERPEKKGSVSYMRIEPARSWRGSYSTATRGSPTPPRSLPLSALHAGHSSFASSPE